MANKKLTKVEEFYLIENMSAGVSAEEVAKNLGRTVKFVNDTYGKNTKVVETPPSVPFVSPPDLSPVTGQPKIQEMSMAGKLIIKDEKRGIAVMTGGASAASDDIREKLQSSGRKHAKHIFKINKDKPIR